MQPIWGEVLLLLLQLQSTSEQKVNKYIKMCHWYISINKKFWKIVKYASSERNQKIITDEEITNSCFCLDNEKKTAEVMPAKHVTAAALT